MNPGHRADYIDIKQEIRIRNVQQAEKPSPSDSILLLLFYFLVNLRGLDSLIRLGKSRASPQAQG
jgi:hypothetical protein